MRYILILTTAYLICGCRNGSNSSNKPIQNDEYASFHYIDFKKFQIKAPKNWAKMELRGIDSYVGGLTNGVDTLIFDYGSYSNRLLDDYCDKQLYADDTVNGKTGYITKPKIKGKGIIGVYFDNIDNLRFNLCDDRPKNEDTIISILRNIKFKTSDTTKNTKTLKFLPRKCEQ